MDLLLILIGLLLGGGGSDLLDYVPSDSYWKSNAVEISVDSMTAELAPPADAAVAKWIDELDSPDEQIRAAGYERLLDAGPIAFKSLLPIARHGSPAARDRAATMIERMNNAPRRHAIRKLMAIRKLGELRQPAAIAVLQTLLKSDEPFVAGYASAAIAQIERKPASRAQLIGSQKDVWLLPASCGAVVHLHFTGGHPIDYERVFKQFPLPRNQDKALAIDFIAGKALEWANAIGNVRVDAISVGVSADLNADAGDATFILAGEFDVQAIDDLTQRQKTVFETIDGVRILRPHPETFAFLPTNHRLVIVNSKKGKATPVVEMVKAAKSGEGGLRSTPAMANLIGTIDIDAPAWGCMRVGEGYRKMSVLESFDTVTLSSARRGDGIAIRLQAKKAGNANIRVGAERIAARIGALTEQATRSQAETPMVGMIGDMLKTAKITYSQTAVTVDADVKRSPADSFLLPLLMTLGVGQSHAEPIQK
ncbi:MAG TPA: hypothetical protein VG326_00725 [Tepidisphaeraceae bacterium]|nr:hypothetical protein [Tepidisphaeraceae bacterium]